MNLEWNVYRYDINKREIVTFNIFDHAWFCNMIESLIAEEDDKIQFAEGLNRQLYHYFAYKSEYEICIVPEWHEVRSTGRRVDIYTQVMNNWEAFVDYVWGCREVKYDH